MKLIHVPLVAAALLLGGCSAVDTVKGWMGKDDTALMPAKLSDFNQSARFEVRWRANVGDSSGNYLQPALSKDAVYGVSAKGMLTRLNRASGQQVWRVDSGITVSGGVGSGEGLVAIGSSKGEVLAYDEDGKLLWKSQVSSEVLSAPQISEGVVIVRTGDGKIAGLSVTDGKRVWLYERSSMPALTVRSHAGVALQRGYAFAGFPGGMLVSLRVKDGLPQWESYISQPRGNTELERISDITSKPVADDEEVCAVAFQGKVACVDVAQGLTRWDRNISSDKGMALLLRYLYLTDDKGYVTALDKTSGSTLWTNEQLFMRRTSTPIALGDFVVVGDYEGYLHALNREDGKFAARTKLDGSLSNSAPVEMDDGILLQSSSGEIYSLSLK